MKEPGLYGDIPMGEYLAWDAVSNSRLADMQRSAAYCLYRQSHPSLDTKATLFGTATHLAILEPEEFEKKVKLEPQQPEDNDAKKWRATKAYKEAKQELEDHGFLILSQFEIDGCRHIRDNIAAHPEASALIKASTGVETSCVAIDPETGLTCKVRPDLLCKGIGFYVSLKTTRTDSPGMFERDAWRLGYGMGEAFYMDVLELLEPGVFTDCVELVINNTPPYEVAMYQLCEDALNLGRMKYRRLLQQYVACKESGIWPGFSTGIKTIDAPEWAYTQEENEDVNDSD